MHAANKRTEHTPKSVHLFAFGLVWENGFLKFLYSYHILNDIA